MKRMTRRRNYKKRNKTSKGGEKTNTKVHLIVRKSNIPKDEKPKLFYELLFERPAFYPNNLFGYANIQRDAVDEALSWLHLEDVPERDEDGDEIQKIDTKVYEEKFEYGNTIDSETMEKKKEMEKKSNKQIMRRAILSIAKKKVDERIAKEKEESERKAREEEKPEVTNKTGKSPGIIFRYVTFPNGTTSDIIDILKQNSKIKTYENSRVNGIANYEGKKGNYTFIDKETFENKWNKLVQILKEKNITYEAYEIKDDNFNGKQKIDI
jgi:hypothetical protein